MYKEFGISEKLEELASEVENELKEEFKKIDDRALRNSLKVLKAFQNKKIWRYRKRYDRRDFCRSFRCWRCSS